MNKYESEYKIFKNKLMHGTHEFKNLPMSKIEREHLNDCYIALIQWWVKNKTAPEDMTIQEYINMDKPDKKILLKCLETPERWRIHYQINKSAIKFIH